MSKRREPDIDFEFLMNKQGVTRLDERDALRKGRPGAVPTQAGPAPAPQAGPAAATAEHLALLTRAKDELRRLEAERDAARKATALAEARAVAAEAQSAAAEARLAAAEAQSTAAEARVAAAEVQLTESRKAIGQAQTAEVRANAAAARAETERDAALALLDEVKEANPPPARLDAALERAGIDAADFAALVAALAAAGRLGELLRRVPLVPNAEFAHFLDDRVAWTCDGCAPVLESPQRTRVAVRPERCDVCGGSSIQAAAQRFAQACQRAGHTRVLIVGGSPAYHDALQKLAPSLGGVKLKLIRGDTARDRQRAAQDLAGADVAFVWASTVLDHRVGELYRGPKVHTLPVRGIGRMLGEAAKRITRT